MSLSDRKAEARIRAREKRETLSVDPRDIIRRWPGMEPSAVIAGYWPIGTEFDVRPLLTHLAKAHTIVLPVTPQDRLQLSFRRWTPDAPMEKGPFGTRHPVGEAGGEIEPAVPTVVLVPLLAWTHGGHRLGYGGGYYDATLTALRADNPALRAVGVGYEGQRVDTLPIEEHDEPLDFILTERGLRAVSH